MYICLCHGLTDADLKQAAADGIRRPAEFYAACGCRAECASCARQVLCLLRSLLPSTAPATGTLAGAD